MAAAASTVMVAAASNGLKAGANMWHGIELADIRASKCGCGGDRRCVSLAPGLIQLK